MSTYKITQAEAVAYANKATEPVCIFAAGEAGAQSVANAIEPLCAVLIPHVGGHVNGDEAERFRCGEVDVLVATKIFTAGIYLRRDDKAKVTVLWLYEPSEAELLNGEDRVNYPT